MRVSFFSRPTRFSAFTATASTTVMPLLVAAALLVATAACDTGGPVGVDGGDPGLPNQMQLSLDASSAYVVDSTVTVTARVTDEQGRYVPDVSVEWSPEQGAVEPSTSTTGDDGRARGQWTLGTDATGENAQSITATVASETRDGRAISASQSVSVNPGPIGSVTIAAADSAIAVDSTTTLSIVEARDGFGNEITDFSRYALTWTSLEPDRASVTAGQAGTASVTGKQDGEARLVLSSGGAPNARLADLAKADGAAADTVVVDVRRHELRGVWITTTDSRVLNSRDNIEAAMDFLEEYNFNVVFPVVWNQAATTYPSTVMDTLIGRPIKAEFEGRDPLQELVEEAHERGIAVIPWFEFGFAASYAQDGGPIIDKYPSWAAKDRDGNLLTKNGFEWLNPYKPAVRDFMMALVMEVVNNYDVDGVQGDDRLPANPVEGGYSDFTKQLYRSEHDGQDPPSDIRDPEWMRWRADKLNAFGQRVHDEVKAADEDLIVSWSPSVWSFSYREYLQDWPNWINGGYTDIMHPQVYRRDIGAYEATLDAQAPNRAGWNRDELIGFYPGILLKVGGYVATPEYILEAVRLNRERGYNGEVYFFYEGLREFNADVPKALKGGPYEDPAPLPFRMASQP